MGGDADNQRGKGWLVREVRESNPAGGPSLVELHLSVDGVDRVVWFRCQGRRLKACGEAVAAALFLPALVSGRSLECPLPWDARFGQGLRRLEEVFSDWCGIRSAGRMLGAVDRAPGTSVQGGTAAFFTGGVDSFDTLLFEGSRLDSLVYVHGFDLRLSDAALRTRVSASLAEVAKAAGKELIEIETNLRELLDFIGVSWNWAHGSGLACVAHLLAEEFGRVLISSTQSLEAPDPWGSHPETDPLWSSDRVAIEHVGAARAREQKVEAISGMELARQHLRVCYENRNGAYNCGRCEKCVRTMLALEVVGVLGRFVTLPGPLRKRQLIRLELRDEDSLWLLDQNRRFAKRKGATMGLRAAMWICRQQWLSRGWILRARRWYARSLLGRVQTPVAWAGGADRDGH